MNHGRLARMHVQRDALNASVRCCLALPTTLFSRFWGSKLSRGPNGPRAWEIWVVEGHFEVSRSNGSGIRDPQADSSWIQTMKTAVGLEGLWSSAANAMARGSQSYKWGDKNEPLLYLLGGKLEGTLGCIDVVYVCIYIYIYVYVYICIHRCMYVYIYICIHTHTYTYMYLYIIIVYNEASGSPS